MKGLNILKTALFGFVLLCSSVGFAQDVELNSNLGIEHEQVNINHADAETIALALNGIGLRKAEAIVAYRNENGLFTSVDDLIMVKGVGEYTVMNNQERIVFD